MDPDELKLVLKFARDRSADRARQHMNQFDIVTLDYGVTSIPVHLLVDTPEKSELRRLMRPGGRRIENLRFPVPSPNPEVLLAEGVRFEPFLPSDDQGHKGGFAPSGRKPKAAFPGPSITSS